jgi:hypothetical protein
MDPSLDKLQAALDAATPEQRTLAAAVCRALLALLETKAGEAAPAAAATSAPPSTSPPAPTNPLAAVPIDDLLPLAIARLRSMVPADKLASAPPDVANVLKGNG